MVVSVVGDKCIYRHRAWFGFFKKIFGLCLLVKDFYKPRNENIKFLSVGVI